MKAKRNWDKLYNTYIKDYNKALLGSYRHGGKGKYITLSEKLSKAEFRQVYSVVEADAKEEYMNKKAAGLNPGKSLNVMRKVVDTQKETAMSESQAKQLKKSIYEGYGVDISETALLTGNLGEYEGTVRDWWSEVSEYSRERDDTDPTVGQVYFGSP